MALDPFDVPAEVEVEVVVVVAVAVATAPLVAAASACPGVSVPGAAPITALAGAYGIASLFFSAYSRVIASGFPPSRMSVPRPAMLVETVTAPLRPACAIIFASRSCCFAFSTWYGMPVFFKISAIFSDFSIEILPTRTGWPLS